MKITYRFNESLDDSKMDIKRGVKKNDFTKDRIHPTNTPEMDLSSGLPDEGYEKGPLRLQNDNPSFEGSAWFYSNNFNDEETNKRPLHPEPDYLNSEDFHTGDDHLEIHGVTHPTEKVSHEENDNTDSENYDVYGDIDIDRNNAHHLVKQINEKEETKHIYKENTNIMKNSIQEQVDRIKQMILFEEGMSYNDVKSLTEQPEGKEAIAAVAGEKVVAATDGVEDITTLSATKDTKSKDGGLEKVDAVSALEKSPEAQASVKEKGDDNIVTTITTVDNKIQDVTKTIDDLKSKLSTAEKNGDDKEISNLKSELEAQQDKLTTLQNQKDSEKKSQEKEEPVEEPKEEPKEEPIKANPLQTLNINEADKIKGSEMMENGFWNQISFSLEGTNFTLSTIESPAGNTLGNPPLTLGVNYYQLRPGALGIPSGTFSAVPGTEFAKDKVSATADKSFGQSIESLSTTLVSTKTGTDQEIFITAMKSLGVEFNVMLVPGGPQFEPEAEAPVSKKLGRVSDRVSADFRTVLDPAAPEAFGQISVFDNPIKGIDLPPGGIAVYSFRDQESLDNAAKAGPAAQNEAISRQVQALREKPVEEPIGPGIGDNFKLVGPGDRFQVGPDHKFNAETLEMIDVNGESPRFKGEVNLKPSETFRGMTQKGEKIQVQELVSEEGYPLYVVEPNQADMLFDRALIGAGVKAVKTKFEARGPKETKTMIIVNTGGKLDQEVMDILGFKSAKGLKVARIAAPSTKFKSSLARGSYESPSSFSTRGFSSRPDLRFGTSTSKYNPFGGSETGKYSAPVRALSKGNFEDMTKAELIQLISQLEDENEREELNESRRRKSNKNVIKLTEADLYKIVDRVLNENKEGKGCAESEGGSGCIKKKDGQWVIMNNKKGGIFKKCSSKKDCEEILAGYHASK